MKILASYLQVAFDESFSWHFTPEKVGSKISTTYDLGQDTAGPPELLDKLNRYR